MIVWCIYSANNTIYESTISGWEASGNEQKTQIYKINSIT